MAYVYGITADGQPTDDKKAQLQIRVIVLPENAEVFTQTTFLTYVNVNPRLNSNQLNTAINTQIKADVLAKLGLTVSDSDISSTKFS